MSRSKKTIHPSQRTGVNFSGRHFYSAIIKPPAVGCPHGKFSDPAMCSQCIEVAAGLDPLPRSV